MCDTCCAQFRNRSTSVLRDRQGSRCSDLIFFSLFIAVEVPGATSVCSTPGPMAKNVDSLAFAMKAVLCPLMFTLDPYMIPMPFNEEVRLVEMYFYWFPS